MAEEMFGVVRAIAWEDGAEREPGCGLEDCECPDHEYTWPEGSYLTVRVDDAFALRGIHMGRVKITYLDHKPEGLDQ